MSRHSKAILCAILSMPVVPSGFWLHGFNFDQRGSTAFLCGYLTLCCAAVSFCGSQIVSLDE